MSLDRFKQALQGLIKRYTYRMDYLAFYPCTVLKDYGDMTVDIQPQRPRLQDEFPVMTKVPVSIHLPGTLVKIKTGASVLLYFDGGDPTQPRVTIPHMLVLEYLKIYTGLGHTIEIDDDRGQVSGDNLYAAPKIKIKDMAGNEVLWDSKPGQEKIQLKDMANNIVLLNAASGAEKIELKDMTGQSVLIDPVAKKIELKDIGGQLVVLDSVAQTIKLSPNLKVLIGNGGIPVAMVGTPVSVDPITHVGVILAPGSTRLEVDG